MAPWLLELRREQHPDLPEQLELQFDGAEIAVGPEQAALFATA
jgi:hypothetical protein